MKDWTEDVLVIYGLPSFETPPSFTYQKSPLTITRCCCILSAPHLDRPPNPLGLSLCGSLIHPFKVWLIKHMRRIILWTQNLTHRKDLTIWNKKNLGNIYHRKKEPLVDLVVLKSISRPTLTLFSILSCKKTFKRILSLS